HQHLCLDRGGPAQRHALLPRKDCGLPGLADRRLRTVARRSRAHLRHAGAGRSPSAEAQEVAMSFGLHSAVDPSGPQAAHIAHLWWLMFWVSAAVFVAVTGFLLAALFRSAASRQRTAGRAGVQRRTGAVVGGAS